MFRRTLVGTLTLICAALVSPTGASAAVSDTDVPPLDPAKLSESLRGLPDAAVTAAQAQISGSTGSWNGRAGVRDVVSGSAVPDHARFRIASATKMFTATIVLQLAGEGALDLKAPVQQYLPDILPNSYPKVAVEHLLDHTSGLPPSTEDEGSSDSAWFVAHRFDHHTPREVVDSATEHPIEFDPGTAQHYNGVNYFLAGLLIEEVTGHSYREELQRRIIGPLNLRDTYLPRPADVRVRGPHAHGYVIVGGTPVDITDQSPYGWAESGLISTTADLSRFLNALLGGRLLHGRQ